MQPEPRTCSFRTRFIADGCARGRLFDDPDVNGTEEEGATRQDEVDEAARALLVTPVSSSTIWPGRNGKCLSTLFPPTPSKAAPPTIAPSWRSAASRRTCCGLGSGGRHDRHRSADARAKSTASTRPLPLYAPQGSVQALDPEILRSWVHGLKWTRAAGPVDAVC